MRFHIHTHAHAPTRTQSMCVSLNAQEMNSCEQAIKRGALELLVTLLRDVLISERE